MGKKRQPYIIIGKFSGVHGVRGWLRVLSYTRPRENIFTYLLWQIKRTGQWLTLEQRAAKKNGNRLLVQLANIDDRKAACELIGADIAIRREQLPQIEHGQYYWCDLIGLEVVNQQGKWIGKISEIIETVANDVLIISGKKRWLIPYIRDRYIIDIDLEQGRMMVDWDITEDADN